MPYSSTTCAVVNWSYMIIITYIYILKQCYIV